MAKRKFTSNQIDVQEVEGYGDDQPVSAQTIEVVPIDHIAANIRYPKTPFTSEKRVCATPGCTTTLNHWNKDPYCGECKQAQFEKKWGKQAAENEAEAV